MWGPLWQCVNRKPQPPPEGHVVLLNGVGGAHLHLVSKQLQAQQPVFRRLSSTAAYLPGDGAPADVRYPDQLSRLARLGQLGKSFAESGFVTAVELTAQWPAHWRRLANELKGSHAPVTAALVYHHLPDILRFKPEHVAPALVQYGAMFRGLPHKTPASVAYLTRKELADVVRRASEAHADADDRRAFHNMLHRYLTTALGFEAPHVRGVHIEPRAAHDLVLNLSATRPAEAAKQLVRHMEDAARTRRASAALTHAQLREKAPQVTDRDFYIIPACAACVRVPEPHRSQSQVCGQCMEVSRAYLRAGADYHRTQLKGSSSVPSAPSLSSGSGVADKYADIVFVLHANETNSEIATETYLNIIRPGGEFEQILDSIERHELPIVWSAQGFDMELINHENPAFMKRLASSPYVTFTRGFYTHAMPTFHPEGVMTQLRLGQAAFERCGITTSSVGMVPEFDLYPDLLRPLADSGWKYTLLTHHRPDLKKNILYPVDVTQTPRQELSGDIDLVTLVDELDNEMPGLVTHGCNLPTSDLRTTYLLLLRGDATFDQFLTMLTYTAENTLVNGSPVLVFHIDLEAIQINKAMKPFNHLLEEASKLNKAGMLRFVGFTDDTLDRLTGFIGERPPPRAKLSYMPKFKWTGNTDLILTSDLKSVDFEGLSPYHKRAYLWATNSDYLSCQFGLNNHKGGVWLTLPTKDYEHPDQRGPDIQLISDPARIQETEYVWQCVRQNKQLGEELTDTPYLAYRRKLPHHLSPLWADLKADSQEKLLIYHQLWGAAQ